ncbi:hypothetical protein ACXYTP_21665 [Tsukamurella ocularis]
MGDVTELDLAQLESIANQASALAGPTAALAADSGETEGSPNSRWGTAAQTAYKAFATDAREATKTLSTILPEQAAVIHDYVRRTRATQEKAAGKTKQLGDAIPQMPKVESSKPTGAGGPNPDGTWTI